MINPLVFIAIMTHKLKGKEEAFQSDLSFSSLYVKHDAVIWFSGSGSQTATLTFCLIKNH